MTKSRVKKPVKKPVKNTTAIHVVLDRSGSMASVALDIIGGFNRFLKEQKDAPGEATISLAQFDDQYEVLYEGKALDEAPDLTPTTYVPRGTTALLDAIGRTVSDASAKFQALAKGKRPDKVLFLVLTDGLENASREFTKAKVSELIKTHEKDHKWKFVFIGSSLESMSEAHGLAFQSGNMMRGQLNTSKGIQAAYAATSSATQGYRARSVRAAATESFFDHDADPKKKPSQKRYRSNA